MFSERFSVPDKVDRFASLSRTFSLLIAAVLLASAAPAIADFPLAATSLAETRPAIALNSQTGEFFVAYLEKTGGFPDSPFELRVRRYDRRGIPQGGVLQPFGPHEALGRPAITYGTADNVMLVAVPVKKDASSDRVLARFLGAAGEYLTAPVLFDDEIGQYDDGLWGNGSLQITHNSILDEYVVSVMRVAGQIHYITAQRLELNSLGPVVDLYLGGNSERSHDIEFAPVPTTPFGGRYLLVTSSGYLQVFDAGLDIVTGVSLNWGWPPVDLNDHPEDISNTDIAFGRVEGKDRWLLVWADPDNCRPRLESCPNQVDQWSGVWGTYIDPLNPDTGQNNTPFPISFIPVHVVLPGANIMPRAAYNHDAETFYIVWRELAGPSAENDEPRTHIRGNRVDYFVEDGAWWANAVPLPYPNVVLSEVTGGESCVPGTVCLSNEDPVFPDVSASEGFGATAVWESKSPSDPDNLDILGNFMTPPLPDNDTIISPVVILPDDPPAEGTLVGAFNDGTATCGLSAENPDVWFLFEAPSDGTLLVTTCGSNDLYGPDTGMDTVLSLHDSAGVQLSPTTCSDDWPGNVPDACEGVDTGLPRDSALELDVSAGQTVLARVSRYGSSTGGRFIFNLAFEAPTALEYYSDKPSFDAANPGLVVEDFEEGIIGFGFGSPLDSASDNGAFNPGDILPGVAFYNLSDDTLGVVDGNNYPGMTSKVLLKSSEAPPGGSSSLDIVFSGTSVNAVGLDFYHTTGGSTGLIAAETTISVFGQSGLLGSQVLTTSDTGPVFFGVFSGSEPVMRVNVDGIVPGFYSFEGIDNVAFNGDLDADGIADNVDNCLGVPNPDQRDVDGDGFGSLCDADFNNDCVINFMDLSEMREAFFGSDAVFDLDGNGVVNFLDLSIVRESFFGPPGPSAVGDCAP